MTYSYQSHRRPWTAHCKANLTSQGIGRNLQHLTVDLLQLLVTMAKLTREDVLKLAKLARLELTDAEVDEYRQELSEILQFIEQLQAVDVTGLTPTHQVTGLTNVTREDVVKDYGYAAAELLKNVPRSQDNHIKTHRMIG